MTEKALEEEKKEKLEAKKQQASQSKKKEIILPFGDTNSKVKEVHARMLTIT